MKFSIYSDFLTGLISELFKKGQNKNPKPFIRVEVKKHIVNLTD